ncbi:MAG: dihydrolipoamide acetyltransferase family protein [Clostridiaceae bacterium]
MATAVIMPRQGQSVESCIISKWNKKKGDRVEAGDILFSYETDKASFDEEAKTAGVMLDIFFDEGDDVPCLINVCVIGNEGESSQEFNPNKAGGDAAAGNPSESAAPAKATGVMPAETMAPQANQKQHNPTQAQNIINTGVVKISPRARNLAEKTGIDYRCATPTGPDGRIIERDIIALQESGRAFTASAMAEQLQNGASAAVEGSGLGGRITTGDMGNAIAAMTGAASAAAGAPAAGNETFAAVTTVPASAEPLYEEVKLPNIRKVIAKAMHQSLSTMAQLTLNTSFDATDILEFRKKLKENKERLGLENITVNDIIIFTVSRTLANHKSLNAHFLDDRMLYFKNVNMGVAVDTDRGLMVPTLFDANLKSLNEISAEVKKLVKDCQTGTINPDLLRNGSFTVTNLGTLDIESFTPVINPPQTGILGVDSIVQRAREADGEIKFYPAMGLSLTFDHRAVDGAPAARFLKELKTNLESFSIMLAR